MKNQAGCPDVTIGFLLTSGASQIQSEIGKRGNLASASWAGKPWESGIYSQPLGVERLLLKASQDTSQIPSSHVLPYLLCPMSGFVMRSCGFSSKDFWEAEESGSNTSFRGIGLFKSEEEEAGLGRSAVRP